MLHVNWKFPTYFNYFRAISGALNGSSACTGECRVSDKIETGADEEAVIWTSAAHSTHCKENVRFHLTSIGAATSVREGVLVCLFGTAGVVNRPVDDNPQDNLVAELMQYIHQ